MAKSGVFGAETITDQKRLVRGEHWLLARTILRARDGVHHRQWRVLTLAGGAPSGEINAIREVMPKAFIVGLDREQACLEAAIAAGVDDVVQCDLEQWQEYGRTKAHRKPALEVASLPRFDVVNLDLCAGANETSRTLLSVYKVLVSLGGVLMFTFSYGRDVTEVFAYQRPFWGAHRLREAGAPPQVIQRLGYLIGSAMENKLQSVMIYRGAQMPMVSLLFSSSCHRPLSVVQVEALDFELAVCYPDAANLYDCPRDRIDSMRRKHAALKAHITRRDRMSKSQAGQEVQHVAVER